MHEPLHPGLIVKDTLIDEATGLSITEAAEKMALRLAKFFNTSIEMRINLQAQYAAWFIQQHANDINIKSFEKAA